MPTSVRKSSRGGYDIVKRMPSGGTKKVGHSTSKSKAQAAARIRDEAHRRKAR